MSYRSNSPSGAGIRQKEQDMTKQKRKQGRRGILKALSVGGLGALLFGSVAKATPQKPGLAQIKCCGTCGNLCNVRVLSAEPENIAIPAFGWCGLVDVPKDKAASGPLALIALIALKGLDPVNRHFLQTCGQWKPRKD